MGEKNVGDVELEISLKLDHALPEILQELGYTLPKSHRAKASLLDLTGRKKRSNASAEKWSPASGRIEIRFEPIAEEQHDAQISRTAASEATAKSEKAVEKVPGVHPAEADLLMALDRAEARPGWSFVPLKKFRDEILPLEHLASMRTDVEQRGALNAAIEKKFVLVGKVPNPKAPQFPVTTIRLNRLLPAVQAALGQTGRQDMDFHPVEIAGEPLSATILRERR